LLLYKQKTTVFELWLNVYGLQRCSAESTYEQSLLGPGYKQQVVVFFYAGVVAVSGPYYSWLEMVEFFNVIYLFMNNIFNIF